MPPPDPGHDAERPGLHTRATSENVEQTSNDEAKRTPRVRQTACICGECISVDRLPRPRLREVSMLAEFVGRRLEVLEGVSR